MTDNLLFKQLVPINTKLNIYVPTVGEILEDEDSYYSLVSLLTAMPVDLMVQLFDAGIDFAEINEYDLFLLLFPGIKASDTRLVFGDLDLGNFVMAQNNQNDMVVLWDEKNDIVIDRAIHGQIASTLRKIHHLEKNMRKPANEDGKKYMIKRAREKQKRQKNRLQDSQLESLIVAMVNAPQYKYDFEGTRGLSIYQFNESVRQVIKKVDYDNKMFGVYTGNINAKDLSQDDLNWLSHK